MSIPTTHPCHRRAVSIVAVLVATPLMLGCAVLAIDVGQLGVLPAEAGIDVVEERHGGNTKRPRKL